MSQGPNGIGQPWIPKTTVTTKVVDPPKSNRKEAIMQQQFEHTWELIYYYLVQGVKNLKRLIKIFVIPLAIAMVISIILESIPTYSLTGIIRPIAFFVISITASYNSLIPRTIYWVILFTLGRKMFYRVKREGFSPTIESFKTFPSIIAKTKGVLGKNFLYVFFAAVGTGFIAANYLTRNNRIDKATVIIVIAITILDTLLRGSKTMFFMFLKLAHKDLAALAKKKVGFSDSHVYGVGLGFSVGLLGNLIFAIIKLDFGGYILGALILVPTSALLHMKSKGVKDH
jgi:hypothetical protein